ncbi:MAG TPA: hypothetical protein VHG33_05165 [Woeseiaceae bacterium]|nr:hypothetical protein [Woeseiaceae bacterium]
MKNRLIKETALFVVLGFIGLAVLPLCIYLVGQAVFGEYGNGGFSGFFAELHRKLRQGEPTVWFLLFSPYLLWQLLRLILWASRQFGRDDDDADLDGREAPGKL